MVVFRPNFMPILEETCRDIKRLKQIGRYFVAEVVDEAITAMINVGESALEKDEMTDGMKLVQLLISCVKAWHAVTNPKNQPCYQSFMPMLWFLALLLRGGIMFCLRQPMV
ncbi:hypothetical protein SLEP1_g24811 [Rubroshorea leprosula]|uniref:Uncharacterized protein n=1 Tax=Rubroshorea leprosula TaxID=152421 RepID=A0AAV5JGQ8_9ROSI|nr:hypothetical protein SLEP1_g24811 [Rubroshorea leprosula]